MIDMTLMVALLGIVGGSDPSRQQEIVDRIRYTYQANKESFTSGEFRFTITQGRANSIEEAKQGSIRNPIKTSGYYVFKGRMSRYERIVASDVFLANSKLGADGRLSVGVSPCRLLCDQEVTLYDWPAAQELDSGEPRWSYNPQILAGTGVYERFYKFPLHIGSNIAHYYDVYADLTNALSGKEYQLKEVRIEGKNLGYAFLESKMGTREYWLDLNRGAIPIRIHDYYYERNRHDELYNDDIVEIKGAGFLPRTTLEVTEGGQIVVLLKIDSYNVGPTPPDSSFALDFPKPVGLLDIPKSLRYGPRTSWSLLNLPKAGSASTKKVQIGGSPVEPEMPGPIEQSPVFPKYAGILTLVFIAGLLWWLGGRRSRLAQA